MNIGLTACVKCCRLTRVNCLDDMPATRTPLNSRIDLTDRTDDVSLYVNVEPDPVPTKDKYDKIKDIVYIITLIISTSISLYTCIKVSAM